MKYLRLDLFIILMLFQTSLSLAETIITGYDKKGKVTKNIGIATSYTREAMAISKNICKDFGFRVGMADFDECTLKIMNKNSEINNDKDSKEFIMRNSYTWGLQNKNYLTSNIKSNTDYSIANNATSGQKNKSNKYIKVPEKVLCIGYINNYGFFKKKNQIARLDEIKRGNINCNSYNDEAYYELQERKAEFRLAVKDLFNGIMDAEIEKYEAISENYKNANRNSASCTSRISGGQVRTSCY